jgi:hypothetical protein
MIRAIRRATYLLLLTGATLLGVGCATGGGGEGELFAGAPGARLTRSGLRSELDAYVIRFASVLEAASEIPPEHAADADFLQDALLFKLNAVSACATAAFATDPGIALIDTWALVSQLRFVIEKTAREWKPDDPRHRAVEALRDLEREIEAIAGRLLPQEDLALLAGKVDEWVRTHPIEAPWFTRASAAPVLESLRPERRSDLFASLGGLDRRIDELTQRVTVYADLMPRLIGWQARWLLGAYAQPAEARAALADLAVMADGLERVARQADRVDEIIERERTNILEAVADERKTILENVDVQRVETLDAIRSEREAVLADVDRISKETMASVSGEREAVLADVDRQRTETLEAIRAERETILASVDELRRTTVSDVRRVAGETVGESMADARGLVRDALFRGFLYGLGLIGAVLVAALVYRLIVRRQPSATT